MSAESSSILQLVSSLIDDYSIVNQINNQNKVLVLSLRQKINNTDVMMNFEYNRLKEEINAEEIERVKEEKKRRDIRERDKRQKQSQNDKYHYEEYKKRMEESNVSSRDLMVLRNSYDILNSLEESCNTYNKCYPELKNDINVKICVNKVISITDVKEIQNVNFNNVFIDHESHKQCVNKSYVIPKDDHKTRVIALYKNRYDDVKSKLKNILTKAPRLLEIAKDFKKIKKGKEDAGQMLQEMRGHQLSTEEFEFISTKIIRIINHDSTVGDELQDLNMEIMITLKEIFEILGKSDDYNVYSIDPGVNVCHQQLRKKR